ncbi:hypothetical protein VYU27_008596, partial [Nannochloropsis oceanica]
MTEDLIKRILEAEGPTWRAKYAWRFVWLMEEVWAVLWASLKALQVTGSALWAMIGVLIVCSYRYQCKLVLIELEEARRERKNLSEHMIRWLDEADEWRRRMEDTRGGEREDSRDSRDSSRSPPLVSSILLLHSSASS